MEINYKPEVCGCCNQTKTYVLAIDRGTVEIVKAIATYIGAKGINVVHPRKELEGVLLTSNQVGNLSRPRLHGLIAKIIGETGNYCLTTKGANFLRGGEVPRVAIIQKGLDQKGLRNIGYFNAEELTCNVYSNYRVEDKYWDGINYTIKEGRVIRDNLIEQKNLI